MLKPIMEFFGVGGGEQFFPMNYLKSHLPRRVKKPFTSTDSLGKSGSNNTAKL
jgi:hypothetical protein